MTESKTKIGAREEAARTRYAAGEVTWDDVLAARAEDDATAKAAAEQAARDAEEQRKRSEEDGARAREEAEKRAAKERERREAAPRKRLAEIRAACEKPMLPVKEIEKFAEATAVTLAIHAKSSKANADRDALQREFSALTKEIEGDVEAYSHHRFNGLTGVSSVVHTAFRAKSWQTAASAHFGTEHDRLPNTATGRDLFISTLKAVRDAGGPDIVPSRRELDRHLDGDATPDPAAAPSPEPDPVDPPGGTLSRIGKSLKDAFSGAA